VTTTPLLCVTLTAPTMAELRAARDRVAHADLVELRLDTVADPSVEGALQGRRTPVIVTCRASWEGGAFQGSEEERHRILKDAIRSDAEYVDVEWRARFDDLLAATSGRRIVLSSHDFERMPEAPSLARAMRATGAEIVKIAGKASRLSDCLSLLNVDAAPDGRGRAVLIAMGDAGLATRVLAGRFGSAWTYAGGLGSVGQVTAKSLLENFRFRKVTDRTRIFGLVGSPIGHSVSPAMHNAAFEAADLDAVYLPLPASDADDFVTFARAIGLRGASVTIPFKVPLFERADVDDDARRIGALNTIFVENGRWLGRNTDLQGFLQPLDDRQIDVRGRRVSVLGAGGSARSVVVALESRGADVTVHARDRARAEAVASIGSANVGPWPPERGRWDVLVNCTPIGMHPKRDDSPVLARDLENGSVVYDLVYNPTETMLLRDARAAGCQTIGGLDMLVAQAVEQFSWWTGTRPDPGVMRAAAIERLTEFNTR
jgi:3-dehydroquinate dehydratase / shikimate dehydrogenase